VKIFQNGWITFDLILVVVSWIFNTGTFKALRALRILRVLPRVEAFKHVITSVVTVLPKMGTVALLMMLIVFIFSILMTQLFG
jgi:voltage-gated sodium channel